MKASDYFAAEQALPAVWNCCMESPTAIYAYASGERLYVCQGCSVMAKIAGMTRVAAVSLAKRQTPEQLLRAFQAAYAAFDADPTRAQLYRARLAYERASAWAKLDDWQYLILRNEFDLALWADEAA